MGYPWEDLSERDFEAVVVALAKYLFGFGVSSFANGPDGGRDARFHGTAEKFPSAAQPWSGITVFQAKHTIAINAHCSDPDFSGEGKSSVLTEEIPRIRKLVSDGQAHNYFLVTNRRLGGIADADIRRRLQGEVGLGDDRLHIAGIEFLNETLHYFPRLLERAGVKEVNAPLLVSSADLAEVILAIARGLKILPAVEDDPVVDRVSYAAKNQINGMTPDFAETLRKRYLPLEGQIRAFLANPQNVSILELYESAVDELQLKILAHAREYNSFDRMFNYLFDLLVRRDGVLARERRLTRGLLFYMYWHCDIGRSTDADS